jgi:hypothetical protein
MSHNVSLQLLMLILYYSPPIMIFITDIHNVALMASVLANNYDRLNFI